MHPGKMIRRARFGLSVLIIWFVNLSGAETGLPGDSGLQVHSGAWFESLVWQAVSNRKSSVVIPAGTYRVGLPLNPILRSHLYFSNLQNMSIDARGVRFVCTELTRAMSFRHCRNVSLRGLTIDYDPLPFTQVRVSGISADGSNVDFQVLDGYPSLRTNLYRLARVRKVQFYDPKSLLIKRGVYDLYGVEVSGFEARQARLKVVPATIQGLIQVGDLATFAFDAPLQLGHTVHLEGCEGMVFEEVTLQSGLPGFAWYDWGGSDSRYLSCQITPGPMPRGAKIERLISTLWDGVHVIDAVRGPVVSHCLFDRQGDDGVAIHSHFSFVLGESGKEMRLAPYYLRQYNPYMGFREGETLRTLNPATGKMGPLVRITGLRWENEGESKALLTEVKNAALLREKANFREVLVLTLDQSSMAGKGDLAWLPGRSGNGFKIISNTFRHSRARGIFVRASDGLIEGNRLEGIAMYGIGACPDVYYNESAFSENLVIRDNHISDSGFAFPTGNLDSPQAASGIVITTSWGKGRLSPAGGHRNIRIENNRFENCLGVNLLLGSATGVQVLGNQFAGALHTLRQAGQTFGVDNKKLVWIDEVEDVRFAGNEVTRLGPVAQGRLVGMGSNAVKIRGAEDGFKGK